MGLLLVIVGFGWALIGLANLVVIFTRGGNGESVFLVGILFNVLLFILPGLVVGGLGLVLRSRTRDRDNSDQARFARGEIGKCPRCAEFVQIDARQCRHCGVAMAAPGVR